MTNRLRGIKEDARSRRFEDVVRCGKLKHDPEKWVPVFRKRSCSDKSIERDDDSKKSHPALASKQIPARGKRRGAVLAERLDDVAADPPFVHFIRAIDQPLRAHLGVPFL